MAGDGFLRERKTPGAIKGRQFPPLRLAEEETKEEREGGIVGSKQLTISRNDIQTTYG